MHNVAVIRIGVRRHLGGLFGLGEKEVKGKRAPLSQDRPPCGAHGDFILYPTLLDRFDHQQVHVAVLVRVPVGIRSEENHLLGVELLHKNLQIRQEAVGDPVDRVSRVPENVFPDLCWIHRVNGIVVPKRGQFRKESKGYQFFPVDI